MERMERKSKIPILLWPTLCLALALVVIKITYVAISQQWEPWFSLEMAFSWTFLSWAAAASQYDLLFALAAGQAAELLLRLTASRPRWFRCIHFGFLIFATACVAYAIVGRQVFAYFGSQLTWNLLTLGGEATKLASSIAPFLTPEALTAFIGTPILYLLGVRLLGRWSRSWAPRQRTAAFSWSIAAIVLWLGLGFRLADSPWFEAQDRYIVENPHSTMLLSALPDIWGMDQTFAATEFPPEDLQDFKISPAPVLASAQSNPFQKPLRERPVKNVILIVLESVGAQALTVYNPASTATPHLAAEARQAAVFDNYYSPVGWTAYALNSLLYSIHPPLKRYSENSFELPGPSFPSVASVLRQRGYQTVLMASGNPHWANPEILDNGDFQLIRTERNLSDAKANSSWGVRDQYLFDNIKDFLNNRDERPFFMVAWTDQTHHPYSLGSKEKNKALDDQERYRTILKEVDGYIGGLLKFLREKKLDEETLVVITGDHGEAFHELHNTSGHGFSVYEEELHVPLILLNPRLFPREDRVPTIGSHTDLAPTLLEILGEPAPVEWHGASLFADNRPPRAYFFAAAWGQYLLGIREAQWKYIFDVRREKGELYNLLEDPTEQINLAAEFPDRANRLRQRLAAMRKANQCIWNAASGPEDCSKPNRITRLQMSATPILSGSPQGINPRLGTPVQP